MTYEISRDKRMRHLQDEPPRPGRQIGIDVFLGPVALSEVDLRNLDLRESNLIGADLRQTQLDRACLYGANVDGAEMSASSLVGADFRVSALPDSLQGATYDELTALPNDLSPSAYQMQLVTCGMPSCFSRCKRRAAAVFQAG